MKKVRRAPDNMYCRRSIEQVCIFEPIVLFAVRPDSPRPPPSPIHPAHPKYLVATVPHLMRPHTSTSPKQNTHTIQHLHTSTPSPVTLCPPPTPSAGGSKQVRMRAGLARLRLGNRRRQVLRPRRRCWWRHLAEALGQLRKWGAKSNRPTIGRRQVLGGHGDQ